MLLRRHLSLDVTAKDLKVIYDKQNGKCALTGLSLKHREKYKAGDLFTASIDRIDSSKGYTKDNIQILNIFMNLAKNNFADEEMKEFINDLKTKKDVKYDYSNLLQSMANLLYIAKCGRHKDKVNMTSADLVKLFEIQGGKCAITGLNMRLGGRKRKPSCKSPYNVSVDRIDNRYGYDCNNIQLVCMAVNYGRSNRSITELNVILNAIISEAQ